MKSQKRFQCKFGTITITPFEIFSAKMRFKIQFIGRAPLTTVYSALPYDAAVAFRCGIEYTNGRLSSEAFDWDKHLRFITTTLLSWIFMESSSSLDSENYGRTEKWRIKNQRLWRNPNGKKWKRNLSKSFTDSMGSECVSLIYCRIGSINWKRAITIANWRSGYAHLDNTHPHVEASSNFHFRNGLRAKANQDMCGMLGITSFRREMTPGG